MILTKREAAVLERLRVTGTIQEIADSVGLGDKAARITIGHLRDKRAIQIEGRKNKHIYKVLVHEYETVDELPKEKKDRKPLTRPGEPEKVEIPEGYEFYIRGHYDVISRTELARRLKITKVQLNQMIIQIGIGR